MHRKVKDDIVPFLEQVILLGMDPAFVRLLVPEGNVTSVTYRWHAQVFID